MLEFPASAACYCGACEYPLTLYAPSNPVSCDLCHCDSCRAWSGGLSTAAIRSSPPPSSLLSSGALTGYSTSSGTTRYFCTKCGTHVQGHHHKPEQGEAYWIVNVGAVKDWGELKVVMDEHWFVEDTKDGGGAEFWRKGRWWTGKASESEELPRDWRAPTAQAATEGGENERLHAECHCGGISFYITRPTEESKSASRPGWGYMLGPYPLSATRDEKNELWWLRPFGAEKRTHYLTGICACETCQRGLGFWGPAWAYVPLCNMETAEGARLELSKLPTLRSANRGDYKDVHRDFCGRCGASVFWWQESRGTVIDVAVGLLTAPEGARAENWLGWVTAGVMREEQGRPENVYKELGDGIRAYGKRLKAKEAAH